MNVTCTHCQTVFRVDPAKVPAAGVRARCSVCAGVFWVRGEVDREPVAAPSGATYAPAPAQPPPVAARVVVPPSAPPAPAPAVAAREVAAPPPPAAPPRVAARE